MNPRLGTYRVEIEVLDRAGEVIGTATFQGSDHQDPTHEAHISTTGFIENLPDPLEFVAEMLTLIAADLRKTGRPGRLNA